MKIFQSQAYALKYDGKRYPPRYIISIANRYANGSLLEKKKIGSHETNTFLAELGFKIEDLSTEDSDSSSSIYEPREDKAPELQSYLRKKFLVSIEKAKGFRSGLVLPSGIIIHVSGSKEHLKSGGFYALTFKKYKDLTTSPNAFYAVVLENPECKTVP
jgi:hypothetical protein